MKYTVIIDPRLLHDILKMPDNAKIVDCSYHMFAPGDEYLRFVIDADKLPDELKEPETMEAK